MAKPKQQCKTYRKKHCNHRHVVVQHRINSDSLSQWRRPKLDHTKSISLNRLPKSLTQLITSARQLPMPNFVQIHEWGLSANMQNIMKIYFFIHCVTAHNFNMLTDFYNFWQTSLPYRKFAVKGGV